MEEFRKMAAEYRREAARLSEKRRELAEKIKAERDLEVVKDLELRKSVIEAERSEILEDLGDITLYLEERERKNVKKAAGI